MPHSKADHFDPTLFNQATWCRIQGHPARIKVLTYLNQHGTANFHELKMYIPELSPLTVSQHIRKLIGFKVIFIVHKYPKAIYQIEEKVCAVLARLLDQLQKEFMNKNRTQ